MFKSEQPKSADLKILPKNGISAIGTTFVKPLRVKRNFTYKELSLIAGIVVALVVVFMIWFRTDMAAQPSSGNLKDKALQSLNETAKSLVTRTFIKILF